MVIPQYFCSPLFCVPQVPTLMRATSDDESPCPGYLFEEIGSILFVALQKRVEV